MATELDTPSFGDFSIENTMEMGMGNAELLNDLIAPETSTGNPDDIQTIIKKVEPPKKTDEIGDKGVVVKEEVKTDFINDFLSDEEGDENPEQVEKKEDVVKVKDSQEDPPVEEESRFAALSNDLFTLGVFNKEDGEDDVKITTPEEFLERFQMEKKKGAIEVVNNFIGQFGEDYQEAFQAIYVKGVDPREYFSTYNNIENFAEMDLANEANQVAIIRQTLLDQGMEGEDIDTEIERVKNYGDLESVSTKYHKVLVKKEAQKLVQLEQKAEEDLKQKESIRKQYITNVQSILQDKVKNKEFDGIPLTPALAGEVQDFLLVNKYKTPSGETITDFDRAILEMKRPENHEMKVKVALLLKMLEKDPTLSTIQKTGVTKKSDKLFSEVARQVEKTKTTQTNNTRPTSWFINS